MTDAVDRATRLAAVQRLKMARSAHAYVRGSTVKFYEWLEASPANIPQGPPVWICGDCHLGNLGPLADSKGRVAVQIRDLDQTVIGNPAHDLIRLGLSLASAARGSDLPGVTTARILEHMMIGYETALGGDFDRESEKTMRPRAIRGLLGRARSQALATPGRRTSRHRQAGRAARPQVLGADRGGTQGADEARRARRHPRHAHQAAVARRRRPGQPGRRRLLDEGLQLAGTPALRGDVPGRRRPRRRRSASSTSRKQ